MAISLVNKCILYLDEFKQGLSQYGLVDILTTNPDASEPLFVEGREERVDATYLYGLMQFQFSSESSSKRILEELMNNFQDFLITVENGSISDSGYASPIAWSYREEVYGGKID